MLIKLLAKGRTGAVVMPSFTYRGLPHFARWAGQVPRFCDVDPVSHTLDPTALEACIDSDTTLVLLVCSFSGPGPLEVLCNIGERHNVPTIIDSVDGIACTYGGRMLGGHGRAEVYSLHATKVVNGFEGGYITTNDGALADLLRWQRNFSLSGWRPITIGANDYVLGLNAKLNEMHAAMALASLQGLGATILRNRARYDTYRDGIVRIEGLTLLPYLESETESRNYQMAVIEVCDDWLLSRDSLLAVLNAEGAAARPHYSPALHQSGCDLTATSAVHLPVTERLAKRLIRLPVGELATTEDVTAIAKLLKFISVNQGEIRARLGASITNGH
jgi:dTDP-4-amino-4,6-dideoxygalactose transaminase